MYEPERQQLHAAQSMTDQRLADSTRRTGATTPAQVGDAALSDARGSETGGETAAAVASLPTALLDAIPDTVFLYSRDGDITYANAIARKVFGLDADPGFLDRPFVERMDNLRPIDLHGQPFDDDQWYVPRLLRGEVITNAAPVEARITTLNGQTVTFSFTGAPLRDATTGEIVGAIAIGREITERERLTQERAQALALAEEATREVQAIQTVVDATLGRLGVDELLHELLVRLRTVVTADNVTVLLRSPNDPQLLIVRAAYGIERQVAAGVRVPIGKGFAGRIAASGEPLVVEDTRAFGVISPYLREQFSSAMGVPLIVAGEVIGVVHVDSQEHRVFTEQEVRLLQVVAERMAMAIDRAQAQETSEQARRAAESLAVELDAILNTMPDAVVVVDAHGAITHRNTAALDLYDRAVTPDWTNRAIRDRVAGFALYTPDGSRIADDDWPALRALGGETLADNSAPDVYYRDRNGRDIWLNASAVPLRNAHDEISGAVIVYRDVTARRHLEMRTHEAMEAVLAMAAMLVELPGDTQPEARQEQAVRSDRSARTDDDIPPAPERAIAQRLAELTVGVLGCKRVGIVAVDPETDRMRAIAVVGLSPDQERQWWAEQRELEAQGMRLGDGGDPAELARFRAGEVFVLDMTKPPLNELPNPYGITTSLVAPMRVGERLVGMLSLDYGGAPHTFTPDEIALSGAVAQLNAVVLEREQLLRERASAQAQAIALQEANRRMDEFLGVAGHELRTPLTTIKSTVQLAERLVQRARTALPATPVVADEPALGAATPTNTSTATLADTLARLEPMLRRTYEAELRQERLVADLLDVSRIQAGRLELRMAEVSLGALAQECVEEQRLNAPDRVITLRLSTQETLVLADADRMRQVITNFLTNALKYSTADQPVRVSVRVHEHQAQVRVRDFGPGLPPEEQQRIWDRFHRAPGVEVQSGSGVGLGLGLYISKTIIGLHGGQIGVESAPGKGSTFWFSLPLATPGATAPASA